MSPRARQLLLNLITTTVTLLVLGAIVLVADANAEPLTPALVTASAPGGLGGIPPGQTSPCPTGPAYDGSAKQPLAVGYVIDPWHFDEFAQKVKPYSVATFGAFFNWGLTDDPTVANHANPWKWFAEARAEKVTPYLTWEPYAGASNDVDGVGPPGWSNAEIAAGGRDPYIKLWARAIKRFGRPVYIRLAQEMNGNWYPWSQDPSAYIAMWRHVVTLFRQLGVDNARFVWAPNGNLYQSVSAWCTGIMEYWPGQAYVSDVGMTAIDFGATYPKRQLTVPKLAARIELLRRFGKPVDLSETNVAWGVRVGWFKALARYLKRAYWVRHVIISQAPSSNLNTAGEAGNMDWDLLKDPQTLRSVKLILKERRDTVKQPSRTARSDPR